jgi:Homeodomain-like domain-containing protein
MPMFLSARPAVDAVEKRRLGSWPGPARRDWVQRARIITLSWVGAHTTAIAAELGYHPKTVRDRLGDHRRHRAER